MRHWILFGIFFLVSFITIYAQDSRSNEIVFGLGSAFPRESSPLNAPGESELPNSLFGNVAYRKYVADLVSVGIRVFGTMNTLSDYYVTSTSNPTPKQVEFNLTSIYIGLECILLLADEGSAKPYISAMVLYTSGNLTNKELGKDQYQGVAWGGGLGLRIKMTKSISLLLEGDVYFGSAKYKSRPFTNSFSDEYNPSTLLLMVGVCYSFH
jgi:hypothetical protein